MLISHCFNLEPVEQLRPRAARTRLGVRMYDPKRVNDFKKAVAEEARLLYRDKPLNGPLKVVVRFYRPIQASSSKRQKALKASGDVLPATKPDLDNYIKSFLDALHGIYWADDNQICQIDARKFYGVKPRIEIEVGKID